MRRGSPFRLRLISTSLASASVDGGFLSSQSCCSPPAALAWLTRLEPEQAQLRGV